MSTLPAQTADGVLTLVKDVLALPEAEAAAETRTARLRGVVTDVATQSGELSLHDGEVGISVLLPDDGEAPAAGMKVEVEGSVVSESFMDRKRKRVKAVKLVVLGAGTLPAARPAGVEETAGFKHLDQWISVEGMVLQVRSSMSLFTIQLVSGAASCNVLVRDWPRDAIPRNWIGGRVRVTGVNRAYLPGSSFLSLVAASPAQVTLLADGVEDPLDAPATTVDALRNSGETRDERLKLTGTLLGATTGNVFYARTADGNAFSFYLLHPIDEDKSGRFSTPIIMPQCQIGDVLEVVGLPGRVKPGVHLNFGVARVLRSAPPPAAVPTEIAAIAAGKHVHDLVEVQGRLLSLDDVLVAPGRYRTTMRLQGPDKTIIAFLDAPARGALAHLENDHLLRVQAIVTGAPHFPEIRLWVPKPENLKSLGVAPDIVTQRLRAGLGFAVVIVLVLAGWALMLGRSRSIVRELNTSLERRVAERTAELAAAKDDLAHALSQERELHEMKTRFVSLVSHEFRTPLGVTMSAVEVLRHYRDKISDGKQSELLEDIHGATVQMSGLMEQVLLLGKAEAGKLSWRPMPLDLPGLCLRLVDEEQAATHNRCPVKFIAEGDFSGAQMDEALLRHIINNLLSNAVKYSPEGSPVDLTLGRDGTVAVLKVQDRGIGIPLADQARLFEAFQRASNVGETPGTGLGLLLVKHCVDLHHGSITVRSEVSAGTTFTVRLPMSGKN